MARCKTNRRRRGRVRSRAQWVARWLYRYLRLLVAGGVFASAGASTVHAAPPANNALPQASAQFVTPGSGSAALPQIAGSAMTVTQQTQKAILNWKTFDVGHDASVTFQRSGGGSFSTLNRIHSADPSRIYGAVSAPGGQIYLINQNGIIFGNGAQVNVNSLVASTLNIDDQVFINNNYLQPIQDGLPAFSGGNPNAAIEVRQGATLRAEDGGSIMVFAPKISNAGDIETPDGQTILAASQDEVYLQESGNPELRGLVVEVKTGGDVTNLGKIAARRGNVTLLGFAVNQDGLASATTSVRVNGSIHLLARDGAYVDNTGDTPVVKATSTAHGADAATVTFGAGSTTEILPESDDPATAPDSQIQNPSSVEVMARDITMESGAVVHAPAGQVSFTATANPGNTSAPPAPDDTHILLNDGSRIDVSGTTSTVLPMSRNLVQVDLRTYQLRDAPLQKGGPLDGKTVTVDIRKGTPLADWQSAAATIGRTVEERSAKGGTVSLVSGGDVKVAAQAVVDVSGGQVTYEGGYANTTKLVSEGKVYDISEADPKRQYQIADNQGNDPGELQPGYVQGADAGSVHIKTTALNLAGQVRAQTVAGPYQRLPADMPVGGGLFIDLNGTSSPTLATQNVSFQSSGAGSLLPAAGTLPDLVIDPAIFASNGINRLSVSSNNGAITLARGADLVLPAAGSLDLTGNRLDIEGGIHVAGGRASFRSLSQGGDNAMVTFGGDSRVDVAGQWVNDSPLHNPGGIEGSVAIDGGSIVVKAQGDATLMAGSVLDVSGGAWLQADGSVAGGNAGSISIASARPNAHSMLDISGELLGYALNGGGTLSIAANGILIDQPAASALPVLGQLRLAPDFFRRGGFQSYRLTANMDNLTVAGGVTVAPQVLNRVLNADALFHGSGEDMAGISHLETLPDQNRTAADLSLNVDRASLRANFDRAVLDVQEGAVIRTDPGAAVSLTSDDSIRLAGTIEALGGSIDLHVTALEKNDPGFLRDQGIWLGPHARLLANAYALDLPSDVGLRQARMLPGGQITLQADRGYIVTTSGSLMDVSGTSRVLDVPQAYTSQGVSYEAAPVSAPAGGVQLTAAEGMLLDGGLRGTAADAPGAAGGTLNITITRGTRGGDPFGLPAGHHFLTTPTVLQVNAADTSVIPQGLSTGVGMPVVLPDSLNGQVLVSADTLQAGGFDSLILNSSGVLGNAPTGQVRFQGDVSLSAARRLSLQTAIISATGNVNLNAAYVTLGGPTVASGRAVGGSGSLTVNAGQIDLIGNTRFQGVGQVSLASDGDIRLEGVQSSLTSRTLDGSLQLAGDLTLQADQVYPTTLSRFTVDAGNGTVRIEGGSGGSPVLSAGGEVTLRAAHIIQNGILKAPAGQITLQADQDVTLGRGSVTSVSEEGQIIPFGLTEFGTDWLYQLPVGELPPLVMSTPPQKRIELSGADVKVAGGAVVDVSGGGDLQAYEFIPGIGGSTDVLDPAATGPKYAIVPDYHGAYAPYDPQIWAGAGLNMGDSIHLAGGGGLPAGDYTLLPARYALLPGAFLVTPVAGSQGLAPGQPLNRVDGAPIVAGQRTVAGTGIRDSLWSGFVVEPGSIARTRSEYQLSLANTLYARQAADNGTAAPLLPRDAGQLVISADRSISLQGELKGAPSAGGRAARVDIAASVMTVVNALDSQVSGVQLLASDLNGLGASLFLGGTRSAEDDGTHLDVTAKQLTVQDGVTLQGHEILLAATDTVAVGAGATVAGTGEGGASDSTLVLDGDGALLRVSAGDQVDVQRRSTFGTKGTLDIGVGAVVRADRSIALDATADTHSEGHIDIADGGSLNLGANRISLGATASGVNGLVLPSADLNALQLGELILTSRSTVDLYGAVSFNAQRLRIDAAGIDGHAGAGEQTLLSAQNLQLDNTAGAVASGAPANGDGDLTVTARDLTVGPGDFALNGFSGMSLTAAERLTGQGGGRLRANGDLTLTAGRVTAANRADTVFDAGSHRVTVAAAAAVELPPADSLGARLSILGRSILQQGNIVLHSGTVNLQASGGDLTLAAGSVTDVSGTRVALGDVTRDAPGGTVNLTADHGNVDSQGATATAAAALIDVSGPGSAGTLAVSAPEGNVDLAGELKGSGGSGKLQGGFVLDATSVENSAGDNDFIALNQRLNTDGFTHMRHLRLRAGDVTIDGGAEPLIRAQDVRLTADAGRIVVTGTGAPVIDASGVDGGQVVLSARDGIALGDGAVVDAHATGDGGQGGHVELDSPAGFSLAPGSRIDVAGGTSGEGGSVALRVSRAQLSGTATALNGVINGATRATIEAYGTFQTGTLTSTDLNAYRQDAQAFMTDAATSGLMAEVQAKGFTLTPGVEVDSAGDLVLGTDWDLHTWRFGPDAAAGGLTLRAAGDLVLSHDLSDGFATQQVLDPATYQYVSKPVLQSGSSWSYRLVAGADTASADPLAVLSSANLAAGKGSVIVGAPSHPTTVRTGTGRIDVAAGRDLVLGDTASTIYTAGVPTGNGTYGSLLQYVLPGDYPTGGGDIAVRVQRDIVAQPVKQLVTEWLRRVGYGDASSTSGLPTTWNIDFSRFHQGIGALGGGNVTVQAQGDITNLAVSVPTTGQQVGTPVAPGRIQVARNVVKIQGGGDLTVSAGGDIGSGVFFEDGGTGTIQAGGSIANAVGNVVKPILALGDGRFDLQAGGDIALETVLNPTVVKQSYTGGFPSSVFFTYAPDSAVNLTALGGDVRLYNDNAHIADSGRFPGLGYNSYGTDPVLKGALTVYPGTLRVQALRGDIALKDSLILYPSARGDLELLAQGNISTLESRAARVILSDADPALMPTMLTPQSTDIYTQSTDLRFQPARAQYFHAATPVHAGDPLPVRIVAAGGDIGGVNTGDSITLYLAKQAQIQAGRDILNLILHGQNLSASDVTSMQAGRDIRSVATRDAATGIFQTNNDPVAELGGGGRLDVLAGRNLNLGVGDGIISTGARFNPALDAAGASVTVMAGLTRTPDYAGFIDAYLGADGQYVDQVAAYMRTLTGDANMSADAALLQFRGLSTMLQRPVVLQAFFDELEQSGITASQGSQDYSRGFHAVDVLFPGGPGAYHGNISMPFSRVQTLAGGDINILVPGGQVDGGLASNAVVVKPASELGVVALSTGDVNGFVDRDFLVNQSRVFALDGGDILLWSSHGNIDAGRGAKTALAASPPVVTIDPQGQVVVTFPATVSGSGIRNGVTTPGRLAGNIYLLAPGGVVDAGDAGIGSAGNLTIGATQVIGSDNISVGGVSTGVPVDTGGLSVSLGGLSSVSSSVSNTSVDDPTAGLEPTGAGPSVGDTNLAFLDVEVLGFGEGTPDRKKDQKQ